MISHSLHVVVYLDRSIGSAHQNLSQQVDAVAGMGRIRHNRQLILVYLSPFDCSIIDLPVPMWIPFCTLQSVQKNPSLRRTLNRQ